MRLLEFYVLARLGLPVPGEGGVEGNIELASRVIGDIQQRCRVHGGGEGERQRDGHNSGALERASWPTSIFVTRAENHHSGIVRVYDDRIAVLLGGREPVNIRQVAAFQAEIPMSVQFVIH